MIDFNNVEGRHKFYMTKQWKDTRAYILSFNPLCKHCLMNDILTPAVDVDHIIDLKDDPSKCLDIDNLQPLCKSCHSAKTYKTTLAVVTPYLSRSERKWNELIK